MCFQSPQSVITFQSGILCRFKLLLAEGYTSPALEPLPAGLTPLRVISDYLRYLKDLVLRKLSEQWGTGRVAAEKVVWALTIPADWSESAKQTMREAAVCAGLVKQPKSRSEQAAG